MLKIFLAVPAFAWLLLSACFFALGEYLSKKWALQPNSLGAAKAVLMYAAGSIAWLPALFQRNHLALMGTLWLLLATVATVVIGLCVFGENLTPRQWGGIGLSAVAMLLLSL